MVSHINVCTLIWLGDMERLPTTRSCAFFFREEIGHDACGYPPPTIDDRAAADRQHPAHPGHLPAGDWTRRCSTATVEIPDLGTMTVAEWTPIITGHLSSGTSTRRSTC